MAYADIEAAVLTRLQTLANFNDSNTSRANWKILNRGTSPNGVYAVLRQADFERPGGGYNTVFNAWRVVVEVWQRYTTDDVTAANLQARAAEIISEFDARRLLGGQAGVQHARIMVGTEPQEMWREGGDGPAWLMQELTLQVTEEQSITYAE